MAKIIYNNHGIPLISGPSPGIEMSANYPPMYPALGVLSFLILGKNNDLIIRLLNPICSLLTFFITLILGKMVIGKDVGFIAAILLASTPSFILYSIYTLNYSVQLMFMSTFLLLFVMYLKNLNTNYFILSGLLLGFLLLTNYNSLYAIIPPVILVFYLWSSGHISTKFIIIFFILLIVGGGFWYIRNAIVLGNPVYPWAYEIFGGLDLDKEMVALSQASVRDVANYVALGENPSIVDILRFVFLNRTTLPSLSLLTILGIILIAKYSKLFGILDLQTVPNSLNLYNIKNIKIYVRFFEYRIESFLIISMIIIIGFIFLSGIIFPRYFVFVLSIASLLSAIPLSSLYKHGNTTTKIVIICILSLFLIHPGLSASLGGKMYHDVTAWNAPDSKQYLFYLTNPGINPIDNLVRDEGTQVLVWEWINKNVKEGERIATWESRIYYIKDANLDYFFFLDGKEARPLYKLDKKDDIIEYLQGKNVKYIVLMRIISVGKEELPLMKYLGTRDFPLIYASGEGMVFHVGRTNDYDLSEEGFRNIQLDDSTYVQLEAKSVSPRLFIYSKELVLVSIEYLDYGLSNVDINYYLPTSKEWILGIVSPIIRFNSHEWKIHSFILPPIEGVDYHTLGLYSEEPLIIRSIKVTPLTDMVYNNTVLIRETNDNNLNLFIPELLFNICKDCLKPLVMVLKTTLKDDGNNTIKVGDVYSRLLIYPTHSGRYIINIEYKDIGEGPVDFHLQKSDGDWLLGYQTLTLTNSNTIKVHSFEIVVKDSNIITFGIYAYDNDFIITNVTTEYLHQ